MTATRSLAGPLDTGGAQQSELGIGIIGAGAVGGALMRAFAAASLSVTAAWSRVPSGDLPPGTLAAPTVQAAADRADVVFITVPDAVIIDVARSVQWRAGQIAVHCSGALGLDVLAPALLRGATAVALHPLYTFPRDRRSLIPPGIHFAFTGPAAVRGYFADLVGTIGGRLIDLSDDARPLYHAAAVIACNYTVTLASVAADLLASIGMEADVSLSALLPLIRATVENLEAVRLPAALTGPVVRGDRATLAQHRQALEVTPYTKLYDLLARATATVALKRGDLDDSTRKEIEQIERGDITRAKT